MDQEGIRVNDVALEISPTGIAALVNKQGAEVKLTKLDVSVSPQALNALLGAVAQEGDAPPSASVADGRLQVQAERGGKKVALDLQVGGFRLEITAAGLRIVSG